jgi:putative ABC transport system permease protein
MNQSLLIACRNIGRQKKRTILLAGAIGFGFFIITLVGGFTAGLASSARTNFSYAFGGHLYFSGSAVSALQTEIPVIRDPGVLNAVLDGYKDEVVSIQRRSSATGTLVFGTKERAQKIEGVDFSAESGFTNNIQIVEGSFSRIAEPSALILPQETAIKLGVKVGETLLFKGSTVTGQMNVTELVLVATSVSQSSMGFSSGYANLVGINTHLGMTANEYQTVNVWLKDMNRIDSLANQVYAALAAKVPVKPRPDGAVDPRKSQMERMMGTRSKVATDQTWTGTRYELSTLTEQMSQFINLIRIIDQVGFGIFITLLLITMVGILNSYRMVMVERTGEIGTMRAIGVQRGGIRNIFLWESLALALLGAAGGLAMACLTMLMLSLPEFKNLQIIGFFLEKGHLSFHVQAIEVLKNIVILCMLSLLAVFLPARTASRLSPAVALRTVY